MKIIASTEQIAVIFVMGLGVLSISILRPILPLYLTSINISPKLLGLMLSVAMAGMVIGESGWGWAADKIGMKIPLNVGTTVCGFVALCFVFTHAISGIFIILFIWGITRSALFGPGRGYIATTAPPLKKATFMASISVMIAASSSLGALPSGFLADTLGYHSVFYFSGGIALLGGFTVLACFGKNRLNAPKPTAAPTTFPERISDKIISFLYRPLATQCVIAASQFVGMGVMWTFLPLLATQVACVSAAKVGILFTVDGLVAMLLSIPMGMMADRLGKKRHMIMGLLFSACAMAGFAFSTRFSWLVAFVIMRSTGMAMYSPAALGLLSDSVPQKKQSTVMGIYGGVCENTGIIAGSTMGGLVWSSFGPRETFLMGALAAGLGAAMCFLLTNLPDKS